MDGAEILEPPSPLAASGCWEKTLVMKTGSTQWNESNHRDKARLNRAPAHGRVTPISIRTLLPQHQLVASIA